MSRRHNAGDSQNVNSCRFQSDPYNHFNPFVPFWSDVKLTGYTGSYARRPPFAPPILPIVPGVPVLWSLIQLGDLKMIGCLLEIGKIAVTLVTKV